MAEMDTLENPVQLTKETNLQELLERTGELHIDADFKKGEENILKDYNDGLEMGEDHEIEEDIIEPLERSVSRYMLASPTYMSFKDLYPKMVDVTPGGDIKIMILSQGDGPLIPRAAEVTLHYAAYFENNPMPFDTSLTRNDGKPVVLEMGRGKFIPGLEIALSAVRGPKAKVNILLQPKVAWGVKGVLSRIRPEPVLFVVTLYDVDVNEHTIRDSYNNLPIADQRSFEGCTTTALGLHTQAKKLFERKRYSKAIRCYHHAITLLNVVKPKDAKEEEQIQELHVKTCLNLAVCYHKTFKPQYVLNMCLRISDLIDIDTHCKALFYYGRAYDLQGKKEKALEYYNKALKLEPKNEDIGKALARLDKYFKKAAVAEKEMWRQALRDPRADAPCKQLDLDDEFVASAQEMCRELSGREEYTRINLPKGLKGKEVDYLKDLCDRLNLIVEEGPHLAIIKKIA